MGKAVIAIHGGAGAISRAQMTPAREREYVTALSAIVDKMDTDRKSTRLNSSH